MNLLITAGATREPIDDVRFLSNVSTGRTGAALAGYFREAGHAVTLLHGEGAVTPPTDLFCEAFSSAEDLKSRLQRHLSTGKYDAVIMTAAIADFRPAQSVAGKISSEQSELTLRLVRNEKILPQLKKFSPRSLTVVGFKLTVAADESARHAAVTEQFASGGVDLVVHNDLAELRAFPRDRHPFWVYRSATTPPVKSLGATALAAQLEMLVKSNTDSGPVVSNPAIV
ncbi:MAG TPA: phosphopantothenoylcysteine decarboxylase [Opitutus sp.]|nr:phosphopantothenoylcysteine decarboxylase [Opitutus sp.]